MDPRCKFFTFYGKTIKMLQENTGENLCDLGLSKEFLDMTPKQDL